MPKVKKKFIHTMNLLPKLNFPPIKLRAREHNGRTEVFDSVRGFYVVLTPEEWVRRHLVEYLMSHCGVPRLSIVEEYPVEVNSMAQRADVVVLDSEARPLILVECKATDVALGQDVLLQAARYNAVVQAPYVIVTNGLMHYCYEISAEGYTPRNEFPKFR
jgi:predicted type IV restriction endonuclease